MAMTARPVVPWLSPPSSVQRTTRKLHLKPSSLSPQPAGSFALLLQPSFLHHAVPPMLKMEKGCLLVACLPSPPPSTESSATATTKLYVSGLSFRTTEESLRNAFQNFGQLVEVNLVMDRVANRPRGFAFLRYATENEAKKAIEGMHGKFLDGRVIFVEVAKPRTEPRRDAKQTLRQF